MSQGTLLNSVFLLPAFPCGAYVVLAATCCRFTSIGFADGYSGLDLGKSISGLQDRQLYTPVKLSPQVHVHERRYTPLPV